MTQTNYYPNLVIFFTFIYSVDANLKEGARRRKGSGGGQEERQPRIRELKGKKKKKQICERRSEI